MSDREQPRESAVDRLVDSLRQGGVAQGDGEWTMSADQAKEKLGQFLLAGPHHYVLPLVQSAVLRGALRIYFEIDAANVRMRFHSDPFALQELETLYDDAFTTGLEPARRSRRQLALGLNAALHLAPKYVRVVSGAKGTYAELELRAGEPDRHRALKQGEGGTEILVRGRRPAEGAPNPDAVELPEAVVLRDRCRYSCCQVFVNGEPLANGLRLPAADGVVPIHAPGLRGLGGFVPSQVSTDEIRLVQHGAWTATHELGTGSNGFVAIVEGDRLRTDVSQTAFLQNDAFEEMLTAVRKAHGRLSQRNALLGTDGRDALLPIRAEVRQLAGAHRDRLWRTTASAVAFGGMGVFALSATLLSKTVPHQPSVLLFATVVTGILIALTWPALRLFLARRRALQRTSVAAFNRKFRPGSMRRDRAKQIAAELDAGDYGYYDLLIPRIEESDAAVAPSEEEDE